MSGSARFGWGLMAVITVLHFDFWNWETTSVVFGFLPTGLAWQAGISLAAAAGWALLVAIVSAPLTLVLVVEVSMALTW